MKISWSGAIGTALAICVFLGPFAYKDQRSKGGSPFCAILYVGLVFVLVLLWIAGGSNALYGVGLVIDEPPQILGSGGYYPGQSHWEHARLPHLLLGLAMMAAAWIIGKLTELLHK
jgi:hypothetical protein